MLHLYPQPDAKGVEDTKRLYFEKTGKGITDDEARQMLERVIRYLWLLREDADGDGTSDSDAHDAGK